MNNPIVPVNCGSCEYRERLEAKVAVPVLCPLCVGSGQHAQVASTAAFQVCGECHGRGVLYPPAWREAAEAKAAELEEQNRSLQNFLTLTSHSHDETVVTDLRLHIDRLEATIERVKALRPETVNVGFGSTFVIPLERLEVALEEISDE